MPASAEPLATQCANRLSAEILDGAFKPGARLDEVALAEHLSVSRNTLRECFRILGHDHLLEHVPHRGVFVRRIDASEARDLYAVRRHLELGALDDLSLRVNAAGHRLDVRQLEGLLAIATESEKARAEDDWTIVAATNARFHVALVALAGNPFAVQLMGTLVALTRLRYLTMGDPRTIHDAFVDDNRLIVDLLVAGDVGRARARLEHYLLWAETRLAE